MAEWQGLLTIIDKSSHQGRQTPNLESLDVDHSPMHETLVASSNHPARVALV
jgi:hypothetical protein